MPLGISENNDNIWNHEELFKDSTCHDIAVMSPFLTHDIIEILNKKLCQLSEKNRGILITRRTELAKIKDVVSNFDVYVMKDAIIDGEDNLPEDTDISRHQRQDIHAKLFLYRKYAETYLYVGSMNASERGTGIYVNGDPEEEPINVELMVKLETKNMYLNSNKFFQDVIGEDEVSSPFLKISFKSENIIETKPDPTNMLLQRIKKICRGNLSAFVLDNGKTFSLSIKCPMENIPNGLSIYPLYAPGLKCQITDQMIFDNLSVNQLSELYCVCCSNGNEQIEKVIFIPTKDIPEERDKSIIRFAISNKREFSEYVAFILGDDHLETLSEIIDNANKFGTDASHNSTIMASLYERMIKVACSDPNRLKDIKRIVDVIDDETIVPSEFSSMYQTFMEALKLWPKRLKRN